MTGYIGTERVKRLVIMEQRGLVDWVYWNRNREWTGYTGTEKVEGLVILGQRGCMDWLY